MKHVRLAAILALAQALPAPAYAQAGDQRWISDCQENTNHHRTPHCTVRVFELSPRKSLGINAGTNGGVEVQAWDEPGIEVHARIQAWDESMSDARALADRIVIDSTGAVLRATGPSTRDGSWSVSFLVLVPRRMDIEATAHNGPVSIHDVSGTMNLSVVNGPLDLSNLGGDVHARAQNGPLSVTLSGNQWDGAGLDAETQNGPVEIQIPKDYSAELETGTVNGPLDVNFPLTVTLQGHQPRRIHTTLGHGGAPVRAVTTNGPASIDRP
ncbi:MAG: hypothetical protein ABI836_09545 [Gemmatimonadota bacterium]